MRRETSPSTHEAEYTETPVDRFVQDMRENIVPRWPGFEFAPDNVTVNLFLSLAEDQILEEGEGESIPIWPLFVHVETYDSIENKEWLMIIIGQLDSLASKHGGRRMEGTGDIFEPPDVGKLSPTVGYIFREEPYTV